MPLRQVPHQVRQLPHHFDHLEKVLMDSLGALMHWTLTHWTMTQELVHSDAVQALAGGTISAQACIESKFSEIAVV